ncbi:MAG: hypothetical protein ACT4ON_16705 [Bacteroidota bacterium]
MLGKVYKSGSKCLLIWIILIAPFCAISQTTDSIPSRDTLALYKKIKNVAYKHRATTLLFHAIFVDPAPQTYEVKPLSDKQKNKDPNLKYKGKIIKKIEVEVFDPFGYSVNDTTRKEINPFQKLGNKYHITTRHRIIHNILLLRVNELLDPLKVNESERLLRETGYITDARIYVEEDSADTDSINIKIKVHDKWSLDAIGTLSSTNGRLVLRDKNIFGFGQRIEQDIRYYVDRNYVYSGRHYVKNISNTFVSSDLFYSTTNTMTRAGVSFDRGFYSALARWAGGVMFVKTWDTYNYISPIENEKKWTDQDYYNLDVWVGRSINTGTGKNINRRFNNVVAAFRYAETQYQKRPSFSIDTNKFNANTSLYLSSIGFSLSKFYKDQYIFRFGANEDIPEGIIIQFLYGLQYKELMGTRYYAGVDVSRGKHINNIGYFSANATYGSFFNDTETGNATLNLGLTYFTDLLRSKKWYFRQFLYLKYVNGINKPTHEKITLRPDELYGFNNGTLSGNSKMLLNLEGVTYAPYNFIGFRFAPLVLAGFGMLETENIKLFAGHVYQSYAIGLLIRNENLLNSSFQITFGAYPYLPDGNNQFTKFNPVTSFTVKFRNFAVSKPSVVSYE